jgi:hypothetical protein
MIGNIIEEARLVEVRTSGEQVDAPIAGLRLQLRPVETLAYVRSFPNRNQPPRPIVQFLPAGLQHQPVVAGRRTDLDERGFDIKLLFIDRPGSARAKRFQSALELNKRTDILSQVPIHVQHVSFEEEGVGIVLLAPIVISDLLEGFARLTADGEEPALWSEADIFDGVPEVLAKRGVFQKAPIFVFAHQAVGAKRLAGIGRLVGLCVRNGNRGCQCEYPEQSGSHADYFPALVEWISAMYPPGNRTIAESRLSAVLGPAKTETSAALAFPSVSASFATS